MIAVAEVMHTPGTDTRVTSIDPNGDPRWDAFVDRHPQATPFHHSSWAAVLSETYQYEPRYYVLERAGSVAAAWPAMLVRSRLTGTRLVTLPFSDYCPPLVDSASDGEALFDAVKLDARKSGAARIEVRGWSDGQIQPDGLTSSSGYVRHVIDLRSGPDGVRARLSENARRSLKKARQAGVSTRLTTDRADLETFLKLNLRLRRKHGMLPQPRRFFESIWKRQIETGRGYVLFAEREGQPLAALLCLRQGTLTVDKFAVNDESLNAYRGSHAAMWAVIELELQRGAEFYDMGRSDADAAGLHRYKAQWGGAVADATYYFHPSAGGATTEDPKGAKKLVLDTFARFAPDPVFLSAGNLVYRHLG